MRQCGGGWVCCGALWRPGGRKGNREMARIKDRARVGLVACGLLAAGSGWIVCGARGEVLAPAVEASVEAGGTVGLDLRAMFAERPGLLGVGGKGEAEFVLVSKPRFGSVEELRQLPRTGDRDGASAVYRHAGGADGLVDGARFEVRDAADGTVLASVPVTIRVLRAILRVEPKGRLWLGDCAAGDSAEGVLTIENAGGAPVSFQVAAWRPFYVEDAGRQIFLAPGARAPIRYRFRPEAPGFFETPLILKPDLIRDYAIEGKAVEAIAIETNRMEFGSARVGGSASLPLVVRNRARAARDVEVQVSGPFVAEPERVRIPAGGEAEIAAIFRPVAAGQAAGWLVLREGAGVVRCQLSGEGHLGADLVISPGPFIDMGTVTGLASVSAARLLLTNRGDRAWEGAAFGDGRFTAEEETLVLAPGAMRSLEIGYRASAFGSYTGRVTLAGPTTASVMLAASSVIPTAAGSAPPPPPPVVPREGAPPGKTPPAKGGGAVAPIGAGEMGRTGSAGATVERGPIFDLEPLPVFEPPNFRATVLGDGAVMVEWDPSADLPPERFDLYERQFRPVPGGRSGFVWFRRPEVPRLTPDGKTVSLALGSLAGGWRFEFALAETDRDGKPIRRTPIIEVETAVVEGARKVPWFWIAAGACALFVVLHFVGARFRKH